MNRIHAICSFKILSTYTYRIIAITLKHNDIDGKIMNKNVLKSMLDDFKAENRYQYACFWTIDQKEFPNRIAT